MHVEEEMTMNWKRTARWSWLVLPFLLLALWPSVAAAEDPNGVLYEVTENLKLKPLTSGRRVATAALMGSVSAGTAICPLPVDCAITAIGFDNINTATGKGSLSGTFAVVVQGDNPVDGPELVILQGRFSGKIDLSLAASAGLGFLTKGKWSARGVKGGPLAGLHLQGSLTGTFRLPFELAPGVAAYMLNPAAFPADGSFVFVQSNELSLGVPTVKLEVSFVETHRHNDHGDDD
jgi:hypothetical protein